MVLNGAPAAAPDSIQATGKDDSARPAAHTAPAATVLKKAAVHPVHHAKPVIVPSSILDLAVQHQFKDATLFVWVDDKLSLTRPLHGGAQKKLVVFNGIRGVDSESLKIPAGNHFLRFRALSTDQAVDLSKTISADFVGGDTKSLQITFDKRNSSMHLAWQ